MYYRMIEHRIRTVVTPFITPPPPQDSPNHILNALNDQCIQRVLNFLIGDICDFLNAAEVCKKFQENAKKCYPSIYTYLGIDDYNIPLDRVKNFLSIFGHLIKSLVWEENEQNAYESEILNAEFCGESLLNLYIRKHSLEFTVGSKFKLLQKLYLVLCSVNKFKLPPTLKILYVCQPLEFIELSWLLETYPNLSDIAFMYFNQLNSKMFIEFQALNPQLQRLEFLQKQI